MDFLLILIALIYWVAKSAGKRNAAQKQQEAARARAKAAAYAEAKRTAESPAQQHPTTRPTMSTFPQSSAAQCPQPRITTPQQRRHTLDTSRAAGHAHMETSMTGSKDICPPASTPAPFENTPLADRLASYKAEKRRAERPGIPVSDKIPQVIDLAAPSEHAFRFDPARVREGLIYAEILGKPKALRR